MLQIKFVYSYKLGIILYKNSNLCYNVFDRKTNNRRTEMGEIYNCFKELKPISSKNGFMDKIGLVKFDHNNKHYEIYFTRRRANKYSIIHCKNNTIEWEQFPILPRVVGRLYGKREPMINLAPSKDCVRIFVIMGKPNCITGLDEGIFRSASKYNERYINVMSEARFKEL